EVAPVVRDRVRPRGSWRRTVRWSLSGLVVLAVVAGVVVATTPVLAVRRFEVSGTIPGVSKDQLLRAAGVADGDPMVRIDVRRVRTALRALPQVASATVERSWPDTLRIAVTPEQPLVGLVGPNGAFIVSTSGRVVERLTDPRSLPGLLPRLSLSALPRVQVGGTLGASFDGVLELYVSMSDRMRRQLFSGAMSAGAVLTFTSPDGGTILFGPAEDVPAKLLAAETVLTRVVRSCLNELDVHDPLRPTVTRLPASDCTVPPPTTGTPAAAGTADSAATGAPPAPQGTLVCDKFGCKVVAPDGSVVSGGGASGGSGSTTTTAPQQGELVCDKFGCEVVPPTTTA
ncbi:MAG: cell division protein FtsQ/DivIB, partial [Actinomycetes bacterium]